MLTIGRGQHGSTYGGNPLAAKIATAALQVTVDEELPQNSYIMGQLFRQQLSSLQESSERVTAVSTVLFCLLQCFCCCLALILCLPSCVLLHPAYAVFSPAMLLLLSGLNGVPAFMWAPAMSMFNVFDSLSLAFCPWQGI